MVKVAVLYGGVGPEREVALASGASVIRALGEAGWKAVAVEILADGDFVIDGEILSPVRAAERLIARGTQAVFVALHGPYGEDGNVQGFLTIARIPFAGPDVESAAIAMNKHATRLILADAGIQIPRGLFLRRTVPAHGDGPDMATAPLPAVVKPCRLGSSVGIRLARDRAELRAAVEAVFGLGQDCLIEEYIRGTEFSCPVWDRRSGPVALPVVEIRPAADRPFFDYLAKYEKGKSTEIARTDGDPLLARLQAIALACHRLVGCRHFSRTDFIVDPQRGPFALEVNTIPGMTEQSLIPKALAAAGFSLAALVTESLLDAIERAQCRAA